MHAKEFQFTWSVCSWPNEDPDTWEEAIPMDQVVREGFLEVVGLSQILKNGLRIRSTAGIGHRMSRANSRKGSSENCPLNRNVQKVFT